MIKLKLILVNVGVFILVTASSYAQQNTDAAGGNANGAGGSVSYSVGQIDYNYLSDSNGNLNQGVQQPYEIYTFSIEDAASQWGISVYPNPSSDILFLKTEKENFTELSYQLSDINSKVIFNSNILNNITEISMGTLRSSTYFLTIINNNQIITTFKIIKK